MKTIKKSQKTLPIAILIGSFVIAVAIIINGLLSYISTQQPKVSDPQKAYENIGYVKVNNSPILGDKDAPVTIIEYTDFDCPVCHAATQVVLPKLKQEYIASGKVKFIFKSLPIVTLHTNAYRKNEAALCVHEIGGDEAFFLYYDKLFADFGFSLSVDRRLTALASEQGISSDTFLSCLQSGKYKKTIDDEILEGTLIGSLGTPTWLIGKTDGDGLKNAIKVNGLIEYDAFKIIIEKQLTQ